MAVISLRQNPIRSGPSGEDNDRAERELVEVWQAITSTTTDNAYTVLAQATALGLPAIFDLHPDDTGAKLVSRRPRRTDEPKVWDIELTYSTKTENPDQGGQANPLDRSPVYSFGFAKYQKPLERDLGLAAVTAATEPPRPAYSAVPPRAPINSAGQPFDPPIEIDDSRPILTVERFEAAFDAALAVAFQDAVNATEFFGGAPGVWKVQEISAQEHTEGGNTVQKVTYRFEARRDGWRLKVLDKGTVVDEATVSGIVGAFEVMTDKYGTPTPQELLLNGDGRPLRNAKTTLTANIDANQTSIPVTATTGFPLISFYPVGVRDFVVGIDSELLLVTAFTSTTMTVVRAWLGTTAAAHTSSTVVQQQAYYHEYRVYTELDFSLLGL